MVRRGSEGPEVRMLQLLLEKVGLAPGPIDGVFGPATHGAVVQFQVRRGLSVDGIAGPNTWTALRDKTGSDLDPAQYANQTGNQSAAAPAPGAGEQKPRGPAANPRDAAALRQEILKVAGSQVGTLESGTNQGGASKYQAAFGRGPEPWCADFVSWVFSQAGQETNSPYCPTFVQQLKRQGRWKGHQNPEAGDMVFFDWDGDQSPDHVGIVKSVNGDGTITTIEGNTHNPNNDKQEGVFERSRDYDARGHRDLVFGFGSVA
jgi:cell wall-associated NlpC family hydrolase